MFEDADRRAVTMMAERPLTKRDLLLTAQLANRGLHAAVLTLKLLTSHLSSGMCVHL